MATQRRERGTETGETEEIEGIGEAGGTNRRDVLRGIAAAGLGLGGIGGFSGGTLAQEAPLPNTITVQARQRARYEIVVTGRIERGALVNDDDVVVRSDTVRGVAEGNNAIDNFRFSGRIESFTITEPARVYINDVLVDDPETELPEPSLPNSLIILSRNEPIRYRVSVSGDVEPGQFAESDATVRDGTVRGTIGGETLDNVRFSGRITEFEIDNPARVFVNDVEVDDPVGLPRAAPAPPRVNTVTVQTRRRAEYKIVVTGRIQLGALVNDDDVVVNRRTVRGVAEGNGAIDRFRFTGRIESFSITEPARVYVNDVLVDDPETELPEPSLPNTLVILARGETVDYSVRVSGRIERGQFTESGARVGTRSASGSINAGTLDNFRFSGRITEFEIDDPARVFVNEVEVDDPVGRP